MYIREVKFSLNDFIQEFNYAEILHDRVARNEIFKSFVDMYNEMSDATKDQIKIYTLKYSRQMTDSKLHDELVKFFSEK